MEDNPVKIEIKCPFCHTDVRVILDENASNLMKCPYDNCKEYFVRHPNETICRVIPVLPDLTREIQPIDYERQLTPFDYELASVARIKL